MGGKSVPPGKRFFAQNRDAARDAGRLGGLATPAAKRVFSIDRQCAVRAARKAARARV
jgi:general stress protein YciG